MTQVESDHILVNNGLVLIMMARKMVRIDCCWLITKIVFISIKQMNRQVLCSVLQARFDHNLRDKHGNTPLMFACRLRREDVVKFLLQSAVYANQLGHEDRY